LAVLVILVGILATLVSLLLLLAAIIVIPAVGILPAVIFGIVFLLAVFLLAAGFGLLRLRPWAWWLAVIVLVLNLVFTFAQLGIPGLGALATSQWITIAIQVLVLLYLFAVRGSFQSQPAYAPPPPR
jgi:lysylphosphatidylglycerol synthetase-like protein (DUF2156 family)